MIATLTLATALFAQQPEALAMQHHASASPDGETQVIHQHFMLDEGGEQPTRRVWLMLQSADGGDAMPLHQPAGENAQEPRWSPSGEWIAFVGGPGYGVGEHALQIIRPDGTGLETLAEDTQGLIKSPSWSADGRFLAFEVRNPDAGWAHVDLVELATGERRRVTAGIDGLNQHPRLAPDGRHLLVSWRDPDSGQGDLFLHDLDADTPPRRLTETAWIENMPTWHPAGRYVVYSRAMSPGNHDLFALDIETGREWQVTDTPDVMEFFPAFSRDGRYLFHDHFVMGEEGPRSRIERQTWLWGSDGYDDLYTPVEAQRCALDIPSFRRPHSAARIACLTRGTECEQMAGETLAENGDQGDGGCEQGNSGR